MTTTEVTDLTFEQEVIHSDLPTVIYIWAEWCGPCKRMAPIMEALSEELSGQVKITKIEADLNIGISNHLGVRSLPSMFLMKEGQIMANRTGSASQQELRSWIKDSI